jgi:hypothetical protein
MPLDPPQNAPYMVAGYAVTTAILATYLWSLWKRSKR